MKVYFVRHGSTNLLEKRICQTDDEPLNKTGQKQASELARRFENISIDIVVSNQNGITFYEKMGQSDYPQVLFRN